jgi:hypothetical protein
VRIGTVNLTNQLQDEDTNCVTIFSNWNLLYINVWVKNE